MIHRLLILMAVLLCCSPAHALMFGPRTASLTTYAPSAPVSVSGAAGNGQVTVTWSAGTVDGTHSAATSYNLYRSTSSGTETLWQSGVTSPYVDTASNGTGYYYKVAAVNSAGTTLSTEAGPYTPAATVYAPNAPTMTASAGDTQITYTWSAPATDGTHSAATSYNLRYGTVSGTLGTTVTGITSPYTLTGRTNGTTYYAKLDAINSAGTTSQASEVSATPAAYYFQDNYDSDALSTGTLPTGWAVAGTGSTAYVSIISNPLGSVDDHVVQLHDTSTTNAIAIKYTFATPTAVTNVQSDVYAGQTNMTGAALLSLQSIYHIDWGADGHFKYYNGSSFVNLPTDTTYSANTWYTLKIVLNYSTKQYTVYVNGVSKGTIGFPAIASTATNEIGIQFSSKDTAYSENGTFMWNNVLVW